ncbi:crossover junction endodeoxyribonuclease RuvC [Pseudovibrio exalbescens]|uniref:crossover junction endodeoxyribonuclease RuvC n=1 Tax=Pseudovibrio exalbescens TaxID=197461 RepID=UPI000C9B5933|nr:crossover junction endodeoxyribonuclease RuvC [Pseudovibrio exalbescens]
MIGHTDLCLDLGTTTGWALVRDCMVEASGSESFQIDPTYDHGGLRYHRFRQWLHEMQNDYGFDGCLYEAVKFQQKSRKSALVWDGFFGILQEYCTTEGVIYQGVTTQQVKTLATGKGNASKDEIIKAMTARGYRVEDDNHADALAIAMLSINEGEAA